MQKLAKDVDELRFQSQGHSNSHNVLEKDNSSAIIYSTEMFKKDVCLTEVLEETYHLTQNLRKMNDEKGEPLRTILNEIDAKEYIIRVASRYRVPRNELEHIKRQLESYKKQLEEYMEGN